VKDGGYLRRQNTIEIVFLSLTSSNVFGRGRPGHVRLAARHADATCPDLFLYPYHSPDPSRQLMAKDYSQLWKTVASTSDEGEAVRTLAEIVLDKEGRAFISRLERDDAELCIEILDRVSRNPYPLPSPRLRLFPQGIAEHKLKATEKRAFFSALRRLAAIHGRLPESMMITDEIEVSDRMVASGRFADVRTETYKGHLVAVKTMRVAKQDDFLKIRKVSVDDIPGHLKYSSDHPTSDSTKKLFSGIYCPIRTS